MSRETGRSVVAYASDGECCRVMPVIGGDDILGSALLFHRGELEEVVVRTFERSSSVIGIVLLSQQRMEATRNRSASALLRSLVSPRQDDPAVLANRAEQHGVGQDEARVGERGGHAVSCDGPAAVRRSAGSGNGAE